MDGCGPIDGGQTDRRAKTDGKRCLSCHGMHPPHPGVMKKSTHPDRQAEATIQCGVVWCGDVDSTAS